MSVEPNQRAWIAGGQPLEFERLIVPRAVRRSLAQPRATILKTALTRLDYRALMKSEVDTGTGSPIVDLRPAPDSLWVCLTAYNEEVSAYHVSLSALGRCAHHFALNGEPKLAQQFTICIVVDGLETLSPGFAAYAQRLGIYQPALLDPRADYHLFESCIDRELLQLGPDEAGTRREARAALSRDSGNLANFRPASNGQRIVLLIKRNNRGKLDSHRCFFEVAWREIRPAFFLQVDVGASPDAGSVHAMWRRVAQSTNIAAVSARSHMPLPSGHLDLLGAWQYADIAMERILQWPVELLMGYMSVLSGQFCLTRSDAVWRADAGSAPRAGADNPVMRSYLRGLGQLEPFESNMFLAEDRILGLEIVFQPDSRWELGYVPEANAGIDRCESWNELLSQRRRWTCSSAAARLWMFTRVFDFMRSGNRSVAQKVRIMSASVFHAAYLLVEWLMPGFAVLVFSSLHHWAVRAAGTGGLLRGAVDWSYWGLLALLLVQLAVSASGRITATTNRFFGVSIAYQSGFTLLMTLLAIFGNFAVPGVDKTCWLLAAVLGAVLILAWGYARDVFRGLLSCTVVHWASRPAMAFLIKTHAALNSHNTSWGTKGLRRRHSGPGEGDTTERPERDPRARRFQRFRLKTALLMLLANAGFYAFATARGWSTSLTGLDLVLLMILTQIGIAFIGPAVKALKKA